MSSSVSPRMLRALAVSLLFIPLLSGCVSKGKYEGVVEERDALKKRNIALRGLAAGLGNEIMLRDREIEQLEIEQQELTDEVVRWAVRGAIEMQMLADGLHLVLPHDVLFDTGTTDLSAEGKEIIKDLVKEISQQPYQIAVLGFSDNVPVGPSLKDRYASNWEVAGARATSVVRVMEEEGIPAQQLLAISRGEAEPVASNDTPEGRAQNRRIDIRIRPVIR